MCKIIRMLIAKLLYKLLKRAFRVEGEMVFNSVINTKLVSTLGCKTMLLDLWYKVADLNTWKEIIQSDTLNLIKKWKRDVFDCDNFAIVFVGHVNELYEINSVGLAIGRVYDVNTGKFVGYHAFNVIVVKEGDDLEVYVYEPQTDGLAKASKRTKLGNWLYEVDWVIMG